MKTLSIVTCLIFAFPVSGFAQSVIYSTGRMTAAVPGQKTQNMPRIGSMARDCIAASPEGQTTAGTVACLKAELALWSERLDDSYDALLKQRQAEDAYLDELESSAERTAPLLQAQFDHWQAYRDATCRFEVAIWAGGSGAGPASVECHMRLTAVQALSYRNMLEQ
jgi:uncharacterized protein YecT (DUF1311 family)